MSKPNELVKKSLTWSALTVALATLILSAAYADPAPVPVSQYLKDHSLVAENPTDPTVLDIAKIEEQTGEAAGALAHSPEYRERIRHLDPSEDENKIVILVHKSENPDIPEYLEVFRQQSEDPSDLAPIDLFDDGTSNQALVSTAGVFNGKRYITPDGDFSIDRMQTMHYSHAYFNAPMPFAMFFNKGIAIHAATPGEYRMLGREASHGCVRTHLDTARALFTYISTAPNDRADVVIEVRDN